MPLCVRIDQVTSAEVALAGGKGANLGELVRAGFPVPAGFVITTEAYAIATAHLAEPNRENLSATPVPPSVRDEVLRAYAALGQGRVAVRSSATAEDLAGAAFAGQQDTFLGIEGADTVVEAVRDCWASLFTERAVAYRTRLGIDPGQVAMAVVVQRMVPAELAGVMFTANPVTGARDQVVVDSSPGLGEAVVAGLVTPDHAVLDDEGAVVSRTQGRRETVIRAQGGVPSDVPPLTPDQLRSLARLGRRVQAHFGRPMDLEWALADGRFHLLQARPMTALPPAPIAVSRGQRIYGSLELELLPRRPLPLEVDGWITLVMGPLLTGMARDIGGARVDLGDMVVVEDGVVTEARPPRPRLLPSAPLVVLRSLTRTRRNPRDWARDSRYASYLAGCRALDALDPATLTWADLLAVPVRAKRLLEILTAIRVTWLPSAVLPLLGLRLALTPLRLADLTLDLASDTRTVTRAMNEELEKMAASVRADPRLREAFDSLTGEDLVRFVATDPAAGPLHRRLDEFLAAYGNRETSSILLPHDPTWADSPSTPLAMVAVLARDSAVRVSAADAAQERLLMHPLVRSTHLDGPLQRLVRRASAGLALREDTHFEATRPMGAVRRAYAEMGARLADAGALGEAEEVWYLTWAELSRLPDPCRAPDLGPRERLASPGRRRAAYAELGSTPLMAPATLYGDLPLPEGALVVGTGAGGGRAAGPVRLVKSPDEFGRLRPGEVLVCAATNPAWTPLFERAAAVVVDHGGLASHAAIVARECGIPAVMGTATGTAVLHDGQRVVVDGDRGAVYEEGP